MANWYVSSVAYTAVTQWAASTVFAAGAIVRQLAAPAVNSERCFRVTAGGGGSSGGTEPVWNLGNNATTTDGALTWTECTAQEAHQHDNGVTTTWTAPARRLGCIYGSGKGVVANNDTVYMSSDHAESNTSLSTGTNIISVISVSKAGSVPPVGGDYAVGATMTTTGGGNFTIDTTSGSYYGVTFSCDGTLFVNNGDGTGAVYFRDCTFQLTTGSGNTIRLGQGNGLQFSYVWRNCTLNFAGGGILRLAGISSSATYLDWEGGSLVQSGTQSATLIDCSGGYAGACIIRGVDLSAYTTATGAYIVSSGTQFFAMPVSLRNCKISSGPALVSSLLPAGLHPGLNIEFINCDSGNTNYVSNWFRYAGQVSVSISTYRTGGASDGTTSFSNQMVSNSGATSYNPLETHIWEWNDTIGSAKTATVEISSGASLNNDDIWMEVEYLADSADCKSAIGDDGLATPTTTHAAQPSSTVSWTSGAGTNQKLQVTFTPRKKGLVHAVVKLAKASTTVYVDPVITLT